MEWYPYFMASFSCFLCIFISWDASFLACLSALVASFI